MRIKELSALTGISKETIHYYTRENLLPKAEKTSCNQAEYSQAHVERLKLIKSLQESLFMPLSAIKKIIRQYEEKGLDPDGVLMKKIAYFKPLTQLLDQTVQGEDRFLEATGLQGHRLADFEDFGVITPLIQDGEKIYSQNDLTIGKVLGDIRRRGFSSDNGFRKDAAKDIKGKTQEVVALFMDELFRVADNLNDPELIERESDSYFDFSAVFLHHLFLKLCKKELARRISPK